MMTVDWCNFRESIMAKKLLITLSKAPYQDIASAEVVDMLLTASAFEHSISLLLRNDGIYHLMKQQDAKRIPNKQYTDVFKGLDWFDSPTPFVIKEDFEKMNLQTDDLLSEITLINQDTVAALFAQHDHIIQG